MTRSVNPAQTTDVWFNGLFAGSISKLKAYFNSSPAPLICESAWICKLCHYVQVCCIFSWWKSVQMKYCNETKNSHQSLWGKRESWSPKRFFKRHFTFQTTLTLYEVCYAAPKTGAWYSCFLPSSISLHFPACLSASPHVLSGSGAKKASKKSSNQRQSEKVSRSSECVVIRLW